MSCFAASPGFRRFCKTVSPAAIAKVLRDQVFSEPKMYSGYFFKPVLIITPTATRLLEEREKFEA